MGLSFLPEKYEEVSYVLCVVFLWLSSGAQWSCSSHTCQQFFDGTNTRTLYRQSP